MISAESETTRIPTSISKIACRVTALFSSITSPRPGESRISTFSPNLKRLTFVVTPEIAPTSANLSSLFFRNKAFNKELFPALTFQ